jgi:hypothetical protein
MAKETGDPRPIGPLRTGVLGDLVLRPWDTSRPAVTAAVTVVASLSTLICRSGLLDGRGDFGGVGRAAADHVAAWSGVC